MPLPIGDRIDNLPESDLFNQSLSGLAEQLKRFFPDRTVPVVMTTGTNALRASVQQNKKVVYPFFAFNISEFNEKADGYNSFVLQRRGRNLSRFAVTNDPAQSVISTYHLVPVSLIVNVQFLTNDYEDVWMLGKRWLYAARANFLSFQLEMEDDSVIRFKVTLSREITMPDSENDDQTGPAYTMNMSLTLDTYHGVVSKRGTLTAAVFNVSNVDTDPMGEPILTNLIQRTHQLKRR